ncbi:Ldh family oxidoreductase [Streptomyces sp. NPDC049954]|uniref:Ldh family oxidoreductase n=1 Tax=Streptomyces sp. NPDC049954 TaxID=3155779 RepID=UPI003449AC58
MTRVRTAELATLLTGLYRATGMTRGGARVLAEAHLSAQARGVESHGVRLAPGFLAKLRAGRLVPRPRLCVTRTSSVTAWVRADRAPGPLAAHAAMSLAGARARRHGVGLITVRGMGHVGALGDTIVPLARTGLIGLAVAQTSSPGVALLPHGTEPVLGTTPLAFAAPAGNAREPLLYDGAPAALSWGAVKHARRARTPLPPAGALDGEGRMTRSAKDVAALLPSSPQAQALALCLELMAGPLTGSEPIPSGKDGRGLLVLAVSPAFLGLNAATVPSAVELLRGAAHAAGARLPGDGSWPHAAAHTDHYDLDDDVLDSLLAAAHAGGVRVTLTRPPEKGGTP